MRKNALVVTAIASLVSVSLFSVKSFAAAESAKAIMKVLTGLQIQKNSDLLFDEATAGAEAEEIDPGNAENDKNASFLITGEPNKAITITLPADNTVSMKKGAGGTPETEIPVNNFRSNEPAEIDVTGTVALYVGATRQKLELNQEAGNYEADFQVDVVY